MQGGMKMVAVYIVQNWGQEPPPNPAVRWDRAWPLFLPNHLGDLPSGEGRAVLSLSRWFWDEMSRFGGHLRQGPATPIWCVTPPLSHPAREYVIRLSSFWADAVYEISPEMAASGTLQTGPNLWTAPTINVLAPPASDSASSRLRRFQGNSEVRSLMPLLGIGRAYMRLEVIAAGQASARLHSHSAVDEYYLILAGNATLRMGDKHQTVGPGTLIAKPTGPDLTSHIVADREESVTILDMEIWPDTSLATKDLVHYPDFHELLWRGSGWGAIATDRVLQEPSDLWAHYQEGYIRQLDGGWTASSLPGAPARKR